MIFNFATIDLTEDVDVSTLFLPPPSPSSSTICLPLGKSFTRAMAVAGRVAEGASLGFAFGMVLLELISGFKVLDLLSDRARKVIGEFEWVKYRLEHSELGGLIDPSSRGDYDENEAKKLVKLALFCIQSPPTKRLTMSEAVRILKGSCLDERWESEKEGIAVDIRQTSSQSCITVTDSASHLDPEELSGPR